MTKNKKILGLLGLLGASVTALATVIPLVKSANALSDNNQSNKFTMMKQNRSNINRLRRIGDLNGLNRSNIVPVSTNEQQSLLNTANLEMNHIELGEIEKTWKNRYDNHSQTFEYSLGDFSLNLYEGTGWTYDTTGRKYFKVVVGTTTEWYTSHISSYDYINIYADHWTINENTPTRSTSMSHSWSREVSVKGISLTKIGFSEDQYHRTNETEPFSYSEIRDYTSHTDRVYCEFVEDNNFYDTLRNSRHYQRPSNGEIRYDEDLLIDNIYYTVDYIGEDMPGPNNVRPVIRALRNVKLGIRHKFKTRKKETIKLRYNPINQYLLDGTEYTQDDLRQMISIRDEQGNEMECNLSNIRLIKDGLHSEIRFSLSKESDAYADYSSTTDFFSIPVRVVPSPSETTTDSSESILGF